jgi:CMP-N-acetylneuraminic acid synthetase
MKLIAMIPARLGSKRIPRKNLRILEGKPLLKYAIDLAHGEGGLAEVWVNSESELLGALAAASGARFHKRPEELSTDTATNQQFTAEFLEKHPCDFVIMVNPTSPLLKQATLKEFIQFVNEDKFDAVFSVIDEYAECFFNNAPLNFRLDRKINSQDLAPVRKIVWALTAWRRSTFLEAVAQGGCGTFAGRIGLFSVPKDESCDLDTPEDWAIAEGILEARKLKKEPAFWLPPEEK